MKKTMAILLALALSLCACAPNDFTTETREPSNTQDASATQGTSVPPAQTEETVVSRICTLPNGKTYLEVDGKPYTMVGAQLRVDGLYNRAPQLTQAPPAVTDAQLEQYFARAAQLGVNTLQLALEWSKIEPQKDQYEFSQVDKLLSLCNQYGLKCEFLWFSTNMCGDGHGFCVPSYIMDDPQTYPVYTAQGLYESTMYGQIFYPILDTPALMERERLALTALMAHVDQWNRENSGKNPLIGMQIHNESDGLLRWRLRQQGLSYQGQAVTPQQLWQATLTALDNAGKAVKAANYKIYTRCNMTVTFGVGEFKEWEGLGFSPLDVLRLDGIDIIGDDPYTTNPSAINKTILAYAVEGNFPHIAENMGNYASSPSLLLSAYQAGGAYLFYDLATPEYFVYINGNSDYQIDQGILNPDLTDKPHTAETACIIKGIRAMGDVLPLVQREDFAVFNLRTELPQTSLQQTVCTSSLSVTYRTEQGGIAFAIERDGYLYLYATADCSFEVDNASFTLRGEIGEFVAGEYQIAEEVYLGTTIRLPAGKLMRVRIRQVTNDVSSTTADNV